MATADIIISCKIDRAIVSGITAKGQEWLLLNCDHDQPTIELRQTLLMQYEIEKYGLRVEILR